MFSHSSMLGYRETFTHKLRTVRLENTCVMLPCKYYLIGNSNRLAYIWMASTIMQRLGGMAVCIEHIMWLVLNPLSAKMCMWATYLHVKLMVSYVTLSTIISFVNHTSQFGGTSYFIEDLGLNADLGWHQLQIHVQYFDHRYHIGLVSLFYFSPLPYFLMDCSLKIIKKSKKKRLI